MPYTSNSFGTFYSLNKVNKDNPIVFVHGVGLNKEIWKPQIKFFKEYNTLTYDLLGHGKTPLKKLKVTFNDFSRQLLNLINELKSLQLSRGKCNVWKAGPSLFFPPLVQLSKSFWLNFVSSGSPRDCGYPP